MKKPFKKWQLAVSTFTLADKLKIAAHIVKSDRYTMGPHVEEFERKMGELSGMRALGVSSGSAANHLVFELWKQKNPGKNATVICPAVTWISAVSPAIMAGFDVKFCDVNREDLSFDYVALEKILKRLRKNSRKEIIIWPTALLGYVPYMALLHRMSDEFRADLFMDCCENTLSQSKTCHGPSGTTSARMSILESCDITTTSCYFAHQLQAIEFGFVFFRDEDDYQRGRMIRNHGMIRSVTDEAMRKKITDANWSVDPLFLFAVLGTNFRPSDLNAMFGLCDFARIEKAEAHRKSLYLHFRERMDKTGYFNPPLQEEQTLFCLPIFDSSSKQEQLKAALNAAGIETRPIVGGNLLRQPCFAKYGKPADFPNAEFIHRSGFYCGLGKHVTHRMIDWLCDFLVDFQGSTHSR